MKQNQYGLVGMKVKTFLIIMMQINTQNRISRIQDVAVAPITSSQCCAGERCAASVE